MRTKSRLIFAVIFFMTTAALTQAQGRALPDRKYGASKTAGTKQVGPEITESGRGEWILDIPNSMDRAIRNRVRRFEPWDFSSFPIEELGSNNKRYNYSPRQLPWAVIGDFNGDTKDDLAISGRTDRHMIYLLVLSQAQSKYTVLEIDREPYDERSEKSADPARMSYVYAGKYQITEHGLRRGGKKTVEFDSPGIKIEKGYRKDAGVVVYRVEKGELVPYYTLDLNSVEGSRKANSIPSGSSKR